jgi:hypothetical protein
MAKIILKKTPLHAVVKVRGAGTETIDLSDDIFLTDENAEGPHNVCIRSLRWACPTGTLISVKRNAQIIWQFGPGQGTLEFFSFNDNEFPTFDIVVEITGQATIVLELTKTGGYGNTQHRNQGI